jgi:hypothetical protein
MEQETLEKLENLIDNHYKGLITAIASNVQDRVEANIKEWLSAEFKHQLEHHKVAFDNTEDAVEKIVEAYLERHDYINKDNLEEAAEDVLGRNLSDDIIQEWMNENFDITSYDLEESLRKAALDLEFEIKVR